MDITLIANSGIQLFSTVLDIDTQDNFKMYFHEWTDDKSRQLALEIAHFFSDEELWVKKWDLSELGYVNRQGRVIKTWENIEKDFQSNGKRVIPVTDSDDSKNTNCFPVSLNRVKWEKFENIWFPMPFFLTNKYGKSQFGPTNWCRFKLEPIKIDSKTRKYNLLLAFDTRSAFEQPDFQDSLNETPIFTSTYDKSLDFALCNNEYLLMDYFSEEKKCEWVNNYLLRQYHQLNNINDYRGRGYKLSYLAEYIYLINYILKLDLLPKVRLYSNKNVGHKPVDLIVDIGNSRTCAVLYDEGDFTKLSPLLLQDFTTPTKGNQLNRHSDSFDMRLAFRKADLGGTFGIDNSEQFIFPSMIRLGKEANDLIHKAVNLNTGAEKTSTFSSPKRFLWDKQPQKQEWEFVQLEGEETKPIFIKGISEQLSYDGSLKLDGGGGIEQRYSRKALMTLAFLEILAQARMQINSYDQRRYWGNESAPRQLGRIIVTCPTAMSRIEQVVLRKCAEDAAIIQDRFFDHTYSKPITEREALAKVQVIPAAKQIFRTEERAEWIYDEATASQLVFLYAEINERYKKNVKDYFELYGKRRSDLEGYHKKSLTIGSMDMGAGTTDVMIASYKYEDNEKCELTPVPQFWESFYIAGDDLLKELIQQLVIEGEYSPIEKAVKEASKNPVNLLQPFLGTDVGVSFQNRQARKNFNLQVSVPIVHKYLDLIKQDSEDQMLSFKDLFKQNPPTNTVLEHFEKHFGFQLESLKWEFNKEVVSSIISKRFDSLIAKISSLFSYYDCDIVLLAGRPTSLRPLTDLFLKHYAISPNRLKTMNDYRIGRWYPENKSYPFIDGDGRFIDPKSIVTTGAIVGHLAENGGLKGFTLNLKELKERLLPTTNFFGKLDDRLIYKETLISPEMNRVTLSVSSLPYRIGTRQLDVSAYPSRPFYKLDFNDFNIEDRVKGRLEEFQLEDKSLINQLVEEEKDAIRRKMPLKVTIQRDFREDIERLWIDDITDKDGNQPPKRFFTLQIQSLSELEDFWLDSGIFSLNIGH